MIKTTVDKSIKRSHSWEGQDIGCKVLYSRAGLATQLLFKNKITGKLVVLDCGDGTTRDIINSEEDLNYIEGIVISHGHPDHIGGLFSLLCTLRLFKVRQNVKIYAPHGCFEVSKIFNLFIDLYGNGLTFNLSFEEIEPGSVINISGFKIRSFEALHYETTKVPKSELRRKEAYSYKIELGNESVVYSGDTLPNERLEKESKDVSLLIIEATYDDRFKEKVPNHLDYNYAMEVGNKARKYIIIHRF